MLKRIFPTSFGSKDNQSSILNIAQIGYKKTENRYLKSATVIFSQLYVQDTTKLEDNVLVITPQRHPQRGVFHYHHPQRGAFHSHHPLLQIQVL